MLAAQKTNPGPIGASGFIACHRKVSLQSDKRDRQLTAGSSPPFLGAAAATAAGKPPTPHTPRMAPASLTPPERSAS
jgi:hypothetical protein